MRVWKAIVPGGRTQWNWPYEGYSYRVLVPDGTPFWVKGGEQIPVRPLRNLKELRLRRVRP
jgi:hypothetical protein